MVRLLNFSAFCVLVLGCEPAPTALPNTDLGAIDSQFVDGSGLRDGTVIHRDASAEVRDAATFNDSGELCVTGSTTGVACSPGGTAILGAVVKAVTRDCNGNPTVTETVADPSGHFRLTGLAPGLTEITVTAGSFFGRFEVEIIAGVSVPASGGISDKICLESSSARLAVFTGDYDRVQTVIDGLGFEYELFCGHSRSHRPSRALLSDYAQLSTYDILFFNCASGIDFRATNSEVTLILENLRRFVAEGGSVYAWDLAADVVEQAWPDAVNFEVFGRPPADASACCVCTDCSDECTTAPRASLQCPQENTLPGQCQTGSGVRGAGQAGVVNSRIISPFLQTFLNADFVELDFDLGGWVQVLDVSPTVEVMVEDIDGAPLLLIFQPPEAQGKVAYTSFHTHAQATDTITQILSALILRL